jgi:hypothetical protein
MRKKFDNDAAADSPNSESVWTPRCLMYSGIGFHLGIISGCYGAWAIVEIELGMPVPFAAPLFSSLLLDVGLCCSLDDQMVWLGSWTLHCRWWWWWWLMMMTMMRDDEPAEEDQEWFKMNYTTMYGYDQPLQDDVQYRSTTLASKSLL